MSELHTEIKQLIIDTLDLEEVSVADIDDAAPLFVDGLGLDSIDALELGLALKKRYDVKLDANADEARKHFASINALVAFITSQRAEASHA